MITLANYTVIANNNSTHHRVRRSTARATLRELQTALHIHQITSREFIHDCNLILPATSKEDSPAWISVEDYNNDSYSKVNSLCEADSEHTCYNAGPITALNYLDKVVESWTNIQSTPYSIEQQLVWGSWSSDYRLTLEENLIDYPKYTISRTSRARLITVQELIAH
jgi:hypothetical protein